MELDPSVLKQGAERLARQAGVIVLKATASGLVVGLIAGLSVVTSGPVAQALTKKTQPSELVPVGLACVGALVGFALGRERAFWTRLQAQQLLALLKLLEAKI